MKKTMRVALVNTALVVISLVVFFGALEIGTRLLSPRAGIFHVFYEIKKEEAATLDPVLGYRLKKNMELAGFKTNSEGFVGDAFKPKKTEGVFRIICLGGSTTLGTGSESYTLSYPYLLQDMLQQTSKNKNVVIEVINGGVYGYHSWHNLYRVSKELGVYSPDMYIIMDGLNDVFASCLLNKQDLQTARTANSNILSLLVASDKGVLGEIDAFLNHSAFYRKLKTLLPQESVVLDSADVSHAMEEKMTYFRYKTNLADIVRHAREAGTDVLLVNHPWIVRDQLTIEEELSRNVKEIPTDQMPVYKFGRNYISRTIDQLHEELSVAVVNPQPVFDAYTTRPKDIYRMFSDSVHYTKFGNYILARTIYKKLMTMATVQHAMGTTTAAGDDELAKIYKNIVDWSPNHGTGWPKPGDNPMQATILSIENLKESPTDDNGWRFYSVPDGASEGIIKLWLSPHATAGMEYYFYPRISGQDNSVAVTAIGDDGKRNLLFELVNNYDAAAWTPVSAKYEIPFLNAGPELIEIIVKGSGSQVWTDGKSVLFGRKKLGEEL
ncbi:MAG TPA: SGNH/GDSL hydrolase family protein [Solidesulfovibrio magneticus]|nr:SGNH/GDSL hydrolase family protein [Solidesulfovibrio magneticus]